MTDEVDELRKQLLAICAGHTSADVLIALTEALISAIVGTADTAEQAERTAAHVIDGISTDVHPLFAVFRQSAVDRILGIKLEI